MIIFFSYLCMCVFHGIRLLRLIKRLVVVRQSIFFCANPLNCVNMEKGNPKIPFYCLFGINYFVCNSFGVMLQELLIHSSCRVCPCGTLQYHRREHRAYRPYP